MTVLAWPAIAFVAACGGMVGLGVGCFSGYRLEGDGAAPEDARADAADVGSDLLEDGADRADDGTTGGEDAGPDVADEADAARDDAGASTACEALRPDHVVPRDFATIQAAIEAADPDALICVEPGTYVENLMLRETRVRLVGAGGPAATILDGGAHWTVVSYTLCGAGSSLEGFTLRNGWQDSPRGAAIDMFESAPLLRNLVVVDNVSDWSPVGGIRAGSGSSPTLSNVVVARNVGRGGFAGGMLIEQSAATLEHVVFAANVAGMGFGGGLLVRDSSPVLLRNVVFAGNSEGVRVDGESVVTMVGVTVTGNLRDGLFVSAPAAVELRNAAVTLNGGTGLTVRSPTATLRASYCDAWGNAAGDVLGLTEPWETGGNLSADPGWLDVTGDRPLAWNLHLAAGSPLVDAGDPALSDPDGGRSDIGAWGGPVADGWDLDGDGYPSWWQPGPYDGDRYPGLGLDCDDQDPAVHPGAGC